MNRLLACSLLALAVALGTAGCGDDTGPGGGGGGGGGPGVDPLEVRFTSGSRLKIQVQRAGDAEQFAGVYDSELESACWIGEASDGSLRCVPTGADVVYGDAACTQQVATYYPSPCGDSGPGKFAIRYEQSDECGLSNRARSFEIGAAQGETATYTLDDAGDCYESGAMQPTYALAGEVEPTSMAALEKVEAPRGEGLSATYFRGEDGVHLLGDYPRDTVRAIDCSPGELGGESRCVPVGLYGSSDNFSDAACTEAGVFSGYPAGCEQPTFGILSFSSGPCIIESHVYEVGAALTTSYYDEGECLEATDGFSDPFAAGAQIPDAELPAVELVEEGEGGVRLSTYHAGGLPLTRQGDFVTSDGGRCFAYRFSDGTVRCGPPTLAYVSTDPNRYYADSGCSDILVPLYDDPCATTEPNLAVVAGENGECVLTEGVYEIGSLHNGTVYSDNGTGCAAVVPVGFSVKALGARVPDEEFVEVTLETL